MKGPGRWGSIEMVSLTVWQVWEWEWEVEREIDEGGGESKQKLGLGAARRDPPTSGLSHDPT